MLLLKLEQVRYTKQMYVFISFDLGIVLGHVLAYFILPSIPFRVADGHTHTHTSLCVMSVLLQGQRV